MYTLTLVQTLFCVFGFTVDSVKIKHLNDNLTINDEIAFKLG